LYSGISVLSNGNGDGLNLKKKKKKKKDTHLIGSIKWILQSLITKRYIVSKNNLSTKSNPAKGVIIIYNFHFYNELDVP